MPKRLWEVVIIVLTGGKEAPFDYCLTTAQYCPLPGQYLAIARHKTIRREIEHETIRREIEKPYSPFYSSLFTDSPETPINTGVARGEEWPTTLHYSSPLFTPSGWEKAPHGLSPFFSSRESEELIGLSISGMPALASHKLEGLTNLDLRAQTSHQHRILQMKHVENLGTNHPSTFLFLCRHSETVADHGLQIIHLEERLVEFLDASHLIIGEPIRGLLIPKLIHHLCIELVIIDDRTVGEGWWRVVKSRRYSSPA